MRALHGPIRRRPRECARTAPTTVAVIIALVAILAIPPSAVQIPAEGASSVEVAHVRAASPPIPWFPVRVRPIGTTGPTVVDPTAIYDAEPAPMGIGDFGVGAGGQPYSYNATEFVGNFSWQSLAILNGSDPEFTDQLNVVLQFTQDTTTYAYWIQDVAFLNSSSGELGFENNIWNFTTSGYCLSRLALSGNGSVFPLGGCEGYYAVGASTQPGAHEFMSSPGDFSLLVRSYRSSTGLPEVAFEYWDGVTSYAVTYDNVVWPWATAVTLDRDFYVTGNATAPSGNFYDAELALGGPGGGATTSARAGTDASSRLLYWNGHNLEAPRAVWNFGSDTAETIRNVQSFFAHDPDGTPLTTQLNGTARNATPERAYDQGRVGVLAISAPGISNGTVSVSGTPWDFISGQVTLTLAPGAYPVWLNSTAQHDNLGTCVIVAADTTRVDLPGTCSPIVATPVGSPPSIDIGQSVVFQAALIGPGSGGDTFNWTSLAAGLDCASSATETISCRPTAPGTYSVAVTVTDSSGRTNTSGALRYSVDPDPVVGVPESSSTSVETGADVDFSATPSGGSGGYAFVWTDLPSPCTAILSVSPECRPAAAGTYSISVAVTDSNGYSVTSPPLAFSVVVGPSVSVPVATPSNAIDLGEPVHFAVTASGGAGPYTYTWQNLPLGCFATDSSALGCVPTATGSTAITVSVVDQLGGQAQSAPLDFTVHSALFVSTLAASPAVTDLGGNVTFSVIGVAGGSGEYSYSWTGLPPGCAPVDDASLSCEPNVTGTFTPAVTVRDSDGANASASTAFTVLSDPSVDGVTASRTSADVGQSVEYSAGQVSGGVGGYSFEWTGLPIGCSSANTTTLWCAPIGAGTFLVTLTVTDADRFSGSVTLAYTVFSLPTVATPKVSPGSVHVGETFVLTSDVTPGSGNLTYVWSGLPPGCTSFDLSTLECTPTANGTFLVMVTIVDSNLESATSPALSLEVRPAPPAPAPPIEYLLTGGLVVLGAAVAVAGVWARRRKRPPGVGLPPV